MNKTEVKNFVIWARKKLIADIEHKAGLLGITEKEIKDPLPRSTTVVQTFDTCIKSPYPITSMEIEQRRKLIEEIRSRTNQTGYKTAYKSVVEEVAWVWFSRLIALRFMEVNNYLPAHVRVLSSSREGESEPELVTNPFDAGLEYTPWEKNRIIEFMNDNNPDELFRMLLIKQCNKLNAILPELFEKINDYTELLLCLSFTDQDGVVYHLVHDIPEDEFNVEKGGWIEIIGWMYQYYNSEFKDETFALLKKNVKITKERIPAATQLFTPHWIVRYMVENSLGRLWLEGHPDDNLKAQWKYYMEEAEQEADVQKQLDAIREEYKHIRPENIKVIDPCMGCGHILVYAFDVLMGIYISYGFSRSDAAKSIIQNNLYGLDIDSRARQLAYFALMMKARQHNPGIFNGNTKCHVYAVHDSNSINREHLKYFGEGMDDIDRNTALNQLQYLLDIMTDAGEYGSILNVNMLDWDLLFNFIEDTGYDDRMGLNAEVLDYTKKQLGMMVETAAVMAGEYDVVVTNPPYMGSGGMGAKLSNFVKCQYPDSRKDLFAVFMERCHQMTKINRYQAMITQQSWMFLSSYEKLREKVLGINMINMVHLGPRAFEDISGEVVQTTAFVLRNSSIKKYRGVYARLVDYNSRQEKETAFLNKNHFCKASQENFAKIPGMPIAYWVGEKALRAFEKGIPLGRIASPRQGLATTDNNRFVRLWSEVAFSSIGFSLSSTEAAESSLKWFPFNKGGEFRKWYGNNEHVVNYQYDGAEIKASVLRKYPYLKTPDFVIKNQSFYFKENGTWSAISSGDISLRYSPKGFVISNAGMAVYDDTHLKYIIAFMNSKCVSHCLIKIINQTLNFNAGDIERLPLIIDETAENIIVRLVDENIKISKMDWDSFENSWDFKRHQFLTFKNNSSKLSDAFTAWEQYAQSQFARLKANEEELNRIFIEIYGLEDELTPEVEDKYITIRKADLYRDVRSFISYAVGCIFGRYSLDVDGLAYAGGEWNDGKYSTFIPVRDNIVPITDEEYFEDDITGLFCAFVKETFGGETLEENLDFIARALGCRGKSSREIIRSYFLKEFYKDHCRNYKRRPIYWLFDSGKANGFKALIYMHRYNEDTIGKVRVDYLHRMQRVYEKEILRMQDILDNSGDDFEVSTAAKRKEKLLKQLKETVEYDEKIAHLALARIAIDLDDGVKVNYEKVQRSADGKKIQVLGKI